MNRPWASRWVCLALSSCLAGGCVHVGIGGGEEPPAIRFHTLGDAAGEQPAVSAPRSFEGTVALRGFTARGRYEARVVEQGEGDTLRFLEFERWGDEPAESVGIAVRRALERSGAFGGVVGPGSTLDVRYELRGEVLGYDLVRTVEGPYKARFGATFELSLRASGELLAVRTEWAERPLPGRSAEGLGGAMATAVAEVTGRVVAGWRTDASGR